MPIAKKTLCRRWRHSHEDDTADTVVYRPSTYNFPRSRGRKGFELKEDGSCEYSAIARGDGPDIVAGTWSLDDDVLRLNLETGEKLSLTIVSVSAERLVVSPS